MTASTGREHVGVVGGGMAGLTAALRLAQAGHQVTLWEAAPRLGGQAVAFQVEGNHLEYFYHHLFQSDREIVALIEELGLGDDLLWLPSNVGYFADGKIWPLNGAADLLKLGFIPVQDRLRVGLVTAYLQKVTNWKPFERVTAHDWLRRALGDRAYERTLGAQLKAKFGRHERSVAMVWFWGKISLRTTSRKSPLDQEKLGYPRGSFNTVIDAIADAAKSKGATIQVGNGPSALRQRSDGRWDVVLADGNTVCDRVIATVPSPIMQRLVPDLPPGYRAKLNTLEYEAAMVVLLQLTHQLSEIYWLNIADPSLPFTGIIEHTNFLPPANYGGKHYVYLSKYLEADDALYRATDEEVLSQYLPHLQVINPDFDPSWVERSWVFRERAAQPIIPLHYSDSLPEHRTGLPGLYLANTTQIYPEDRGTNYSVRLGNQIAELVDGDIRDGRRD